jgi:pimeloyl-ACP methyl ester carboxylesterase
MKRLGYTEFVAQGGDWGALITDMMGVLSPPELLGIHTNMAGAIPAEIDAAAFTGSPPPPDLSAEERQAFDHVAFFYKHGLGYALEMGNRPQTLYGIADSPVGLAAWIRAFLGKAAPKGVTIPTVVSVFPDDICPVPRSWAEKAYPKLIYYQRHPKGAHFAAWEQPQAIVEDLRAGFRSLRK